MKNSFDRVPVLTYHKIEDRREWGVNTVPPGRFREQMEYLQREGFRPITFRELGTAAQPEKAVIITFDDAYESVYLHALPILQEFGYPAVVFVIVDYVGQWNTWDANLGGLHFRHLDEEQLRELVRSGWEIGSHTLTHRALVHLTPAEAEKEILQSRNRLREISGQAVTTLAYPFGLQNSRIREMARQSGYRWACQNLWGEFQADNPYTLRRIPVYRTDSLAAFRRKLTNVPGHALEMLKLRIISWSARLTPLYQRYSRRR